MRTQTQASDSLNAKLLLKTLVAFKKGDFSARLPGEWTGEAGKIADTLNEIIELSDKTAKELERVATIRVAPRFGNDVHRGAGMESVLGGQRTGFRPELLQRIREGERQVGIVVGGVVHRPVEGVLHAVAQPAGDRDRYGIGGAQGGDPARVHGRTSQRNQIRDLARLQRQPPSDQGVEQAVLCDLQFAPAGELGRVRQVRHRAIVAAGPAVPIGTRRLC